MTTQLTPFQDARAKSASEGGHSQCNYTDAKKTVIGGVPDGWVFFKFTGEDDSKKGSVAFCADFPGDDLGGKWEDKTLVLLNGPYYLRPRTPPAPAPTHALTCQHPCDDRIPTHAHARYRRGDPGRT